MDREPKSILVVAHQTAATQSLLDAVHARAESGYSTFHLLVPRRRRRGDKIAGPEEVGAHEAREVLREALPRLSEAAGSEVTGDIGDSEPLTAVRDALELGHYDEIIISTLPQGVSHWLRLDLVSKVRGLGLPVRHVLGKDSRVAGAANR
jgi:hypothetical protein